MQKYKSCLFLIFLFLPAIIRGQVVRNQTLSSIGFSNTSNNSDILLQHSVGQLSVVGVFKNERFTASQGFLRGITSLSPKFEEPFRVIPFPNSFSEQVTLRFYPKLSEQAVISVYDLNGKHVYQNTLLPVNSEIPLNLYYLSNSVYLVFIKSGNKYAQTRIIKKI